jgi:hypothetical protein
LNRKKIGAWRKKAFGDPTTTCNALERSAVLCRLRCKKVGISLDAILFIAAYA